MTADAAGVDNLPVYRDQVTRTLRAALVQGRLTEGEYDERMGQVSAVRSRAGLAALTADLPVGRMDAPARPPTARDVRIGVSVSIAAVSVAAAILLWQPDNALAFMTFVAAAVTLLVAPIVTMGIMVDVRRQKRSGG
jgi:energy-converting hydrogenase Eha subunit E